MNQPEKKDASCKRELGLKLANFRRKLGAAINKKKLTQGTFGEMYGGYSNRVIASYELGDVDPPASLLYSIWKTGHSIDALFAEGNISDHGRSAARELYAQSTSESLRSMDDTSKERLLKEATDAKNAHDRPTKETLVQTSGKRKTRPDTASKSKKR
jgi:hypothetical protein